MIPAAFEYHAPTLARRGDGAPGQPRRGRQDPLRRPEPHPPDEAPPGQPAPPRRHQRRSRARGHPRGRRLSAHRRADRASRISRNRTSSGPAIRCSTTLEGHRGSYRAEPRHRRGQPRPRRPGQRPSRHHAGPRRRGPSRSVPGASAAFPSPRSSPGRSRRPFGPTRSSWRSGSRPAGAERRRLSQARAESRRLRHRRRGRAADPGRGRRRAPRRASG